MSEVVYVANHNPVLFLQEFSEKVLDGFYADDSVQGAPFLSVICEIRLTQGDEPEQRNDLSEHQTVHLYSYNPSIFMLDLQDAVLQGFRIVPENLDLHSSLLTVSVCKPLLSVQKATPVASDTPETQNVPESTTEAPVTTAKAEKPTTQRKSKSKEA